MRAEKCEHCPIEGPAEGCPRWLLDHAASCGLARTELGRAVVVKLATEGLQAGPSAAGGTSASAIADPPRDWSGWSPGCRHRSTRRNRCGEELFVLCDLERGDAGYVEEHHCRDCPDRPAEITPSDEDAP